MTSARAIAMTMDEWNACEAMQGGDDTYYDEHLASLSAKWGAAGDQPRTRWCVPHGRVASNASGTLCPKTSGTNPCRVVSAIVVVEEDA